MALRTIRYCFAVTFAIFAAALPLQPQVIGPPAAAAQAGGTTRIAFRSVRDGQPGLFVMNEDGSHQTRLTTGPDTLHVWSADGCRIVFRRGIAQIYMIAADGTQEKLVV